jgi:hypothetical protein
MSIEELQNQKFREIMSIRLYYDWHTYVIFSTLHELYSYFVFDLLGTR